MADGICYLRGTPPCHQIFAFSQRFRLRFGMMNEADRANAHTPASAHGRPRDTSQKPTDDCQRTDKHGDQAGDAVPISM
jgi:hypothetical protein